MNLETMGTFIAACRKEKNLTQLQLAEKLHITNRAVSKWETGKSCPDASIMLELCEILDITVNELLSGERMEEKQYQKKAEENLVMLQRKQERAQKSLARIERLWLAIALLLFPVHLAINYYYPENNGTGVGLIIAVVGLILFAVHFARYYEIRLK
ncbi:helix-turn-helix domain-containing protein [Ihubacter sp. mB4P-1]|uniref:helix-turn-helix domain-containing protein n=1 Tax=Ihubacter sp. mB4P-1 TaxID=3242370 RepID=UPI001379DF4B